MFGCVEGAAAAASQPGSSEVAAAVLGAHARMEEAEQTKCTDYRLNYATGDIQVKEKLNLARPLGFC